MQVVGCWQAMMGVLPHAVLQRLAIPVVMSLQGVELWSSSGGRQNTAAPGCPPPGPRPPTNPCRPGLVPRSLGAAEKGQLAIHKVQQSGVLERSRRVGRLNLLPPPTNLGSLNTLDDRAANCVRIFGLCSGIAFLSSSFPFSCCLVLFNSGQIVVGTMWFNTLLSALCLATLALGATKQDENGNNIKSIGVCHSALRSED